MVRRIALLSSALLLPALAVGCGSSDGGGGASSGGDALQVEAAFYPLAWLTEQVGGDDVEVSSLTPAGAEPHDLELTPKEVARVAEADLVVLLGGFQPAVDEAAESQSDEVFDAADATDLDLTGGDSHDHAEDEGEAHSEEEGDHAEEEGEAHSDEEGDHADEGAVDPHFWLDPTKLAEVATALGDRLAELDPDNAAGYEERAEATVATLTELDGQFTEQLAECESTELVTSHTAFGYLADRYGFEQLGITGVSPSSEPSPSALAEVTEFVEEHGITTIYVETLVPEDLARTVADETGAELATLDPIEGVTDESAGDDYPSIMEANLATLVAGQRC